MVGRAIHIKLNSNPKEGTTLLKFIHGQLYNGKIVMRYGQAPTDECPLCHKTDSCTYITGDVPNTRVCGSPGTMRHASSSTLPYAKHQKAEEPSTRLPI